VTARALGFPGLMRHQHQIIAVGTEIGENGLPAYRQVVIEEPRQQGKSIGTLSLMVARARDVPGTMISLLGRRPGSPEGGGCLTSGGRASGGRRCGS